MRPLAAGLLALLVATTAGAQEAEPSAPTPRQPPRGSIGLGVGIFEPINAADTYDAVYGDPMLQLGGWLELRFRKHLAFVLAAETGSVDGEQVLLTRPPTPTGIETTLTLTPVHLTAAWRFRTDRRWPILVGAGPTLLTWDEELADRSRERTDTGAHLLVAVRRDLGRGFALQGQVRWSTIPDAIGESGASAFYDEDDLGGLAVGVTGLWSWRD